MVEEAILSRLKPPLNNIQCFPCLARCRKTQSGRPPITRLVVRKSKLFKAAFSGTNLCLIGHCLCRWQPPLPPLYAHSPRIPPCRLKYIRGGALTEYKKRRSKCTPLCLAFPSLRLSSAAAVARRKKQPPCLSRLDLNAALMLHSCKRPAALPGYPQHYALYSKAPAQS